MQMNKYQQVIIAEKPCMETWFKKSCLINFEIVLDFLKYRLVQRTAMLIISILKDVCKP